MRTLLVLALSLGLSACASGRRIESVSAPVALPENIIQATANAPEARLKPMSYVTNYVDGSRKVCVVKPIYHLDGTLAYMDEQCW